MDTSCSANKQRHTLTLNYGILVMWEMKPRTTPQNTSRLLLMGLEQVTRPETLQAKLLLLLLLYNVYVSCHRHFFLVLLLNQR